MVDDDREHSTLESYRLVERLSQFGRERIPERVVHARGFVAYGNFVAYGTIGDEPASTYTRAKLFQVEGTTTPVVIRFSTVVGGRDSSEAARDPRGFAVKFKTEDGNWDLVGNNLPVFFVRDALKFPDVIHALKPDPATFRQEPNRIFDFMSTTPESLHMLTWLYSPRGIPANYRTQDGFGVNTYRMLNTAGASTLVKYHWKSQQGVASLTEEQAAAIQATDLGHASHDLYTAIQTGDHPRWELNVQLMPDPPADDLEFDPLDDTKIWPEDRFPLRPVGMMTLDRNVQNFFAENEQAAFGTGVLVDGLDISADRMLVGRVFSYSDPQRHRVGRDYHRLPVNAPLATPPEPPATPRTVRSEKTTAKDHGDVDPSNDYGQAGDRIRSMPAWEREDLLLNLTTQLTQCDKLIAERMVAHFTRADAPFGTHLATNLGIDPTTLD